MATNDNNQNIRPPNKTRKIFWSFWGGVIFFIVVIIAIGLGSWYVRNRVIDKESMPINIVNIEGERYYTKRADIINSFENISLANFFQVDVNNVQRQIKKLPWVYSVSVRKKWPNQLNIYLVDQKPIAVWNGNFLINQYGQVFQANTQLVSKKIPHFFGPEGSENIVLKKYSNFNDLLKFSHLLIVELMLSERFSWQITLNNGVLLNLGQENSIARIQRFMDLYPEIIKYKKRNQQIDYVDLRYDTGAAVGWKLISSQMKKQIILKKEHKINV